MTTRTYRINLVGEPADTSRALEALDALFADDALGLLRDRLAPEGLTVQRLVADATEVVLYITPGPAPLQARALDESAEAAAGSTEAAAGTGESGGGTMGSESPPP